MGDRSTTVFWDEEAGYSPGVYAHWMGDQTRQLLREAGEKGLLRANDALYAAARFCGHLCQAVGDGTTGVGLLPSPQNAEDGDKPDWDDYGSGLDAGVFVVNTKTGVVDVFAGYEAQEGSFSVKLSP
jgi:hypothetical protein